MADVTAPAPVVAAVPDRKAHPLRDTLFKRLGYGLITLFCVSVLIFAATQLLPGNAASAALQNTATPARLHALEVQMGLNRSAVAQYWSWLTGLFRGDLGKSIVSGTSVSSLVGGRIVNTLVLVVLAGVIGTVIGVALGVWAAAKRDSWLDHILSVTALAVIAGTVTPGCSSRRSPWRRSAWPR